MKCPIDNKKPSLKKCKERCNHPCDEMKIATKEKFAAEHQAKSQRTIIIPQS